MKFFIHLIMALMVYGCASTSDVVPAGKDTYMIAGQGGEFDYSGSKIKAGLYQSANQYCVSIGKQFMPLRDSYRDKGSSMASAELHFRCLKEDDPELKRPNMESVPDIKISR
ncbi:hypothetical protein HCU74_16530 [Spongiibacter sp. KMU-166]|uniref:Lipoprotein n=1 Tax=Spongiibacter thalassae TaxID=2721624 RepID=A0ABX1GJ55_9GAMM|nr:hypothetical protein [Spongiibacter thalassae]NKI19016.1 hypothetical protein [Spongiibacter thalassae]